MNLTATGSMHLFTGLAVASFIVTLSALFVWWTLVSLVSIWHAQIYVKSFHSPTQGEWCCSCAVNVWPSLVKLLLIYCLISRTGVVRSTGNLMNPWKCDEKTIRHGNGPFYLAIEAVLVGTGHAGHLRSTVIKVNSRFCVCDLMR